ENHEQGFMGVGRVLVRPRRPRQMRAGNGKQETQRSPANHPEGKDDSYDKPKITKVFKYCGSHRSPILKLVYPAAPKKLGPEARNLACGIPVPSSWTQGIDRARYFGAVSGLRRGQAPRGD